MNSQGLRVFTAGKTTSQSLPPDLAKIVFHGFQDQFGCKNHSSVNQQLKMCNFVLGFIIFWMFIFRDCGGEPARKQKI